MTLSRLKSSLYKEIKFQVMYNRRLILSLYGDLKWVATIFS